MVFGPRIQNSSNLVQREPLKFGWITGGVALLGKPAKSLEMVQVRTKVTVDDQKKIAYALSIGAKINDLDDIEGPLRTAFQNACSFGAHHENVYEDRLHNQRRRCSAMTLDSSNITFMLIFGGFPGKGASYNSGVIENVFFTAFGRYVFGTTGNEANIVI